EDAIVDRIQNHLALTQPLLLNLHGRIAEHAECVCHAADLVLSGRRQRHLELASSDLEHGAGESLEPPDQLAIDVEPDEQRRAQKAGQPDSARHAGADVADMSRFGAGRRNVSLGAGYESIYRLG